MEPKPSAPRRAPDFIRLFAATSSTAMGRLALEYAKSLMRIAPVRVIPADGMGIWPGYESLLTTNASGSYVNVVACGADSWCRHHRIEMPAKADPVVGKALSSSWDIDVLTKRATERPLPAPEIILAHSDYWTAGVRNVLFAATQPRDEHQLAAAQKFDVVIVPDGRQRHYWSITHKKDHPKVVVIQVPIFDEGHRMIRELVLAP